MERSVRDMSNDDQVIKQYPFDLKAEATREGFRVSGHVYGENMDQCVTDLGNMVSKMLTELEIKNLVLAVNQRNAAIESEKKKK
jgi:hypothetical protein